MVCCGSKLPAVKIISNVRLNLKENRATTNAANDDSVKIRTSAGTATIKA